MSCVPLAKQPYLSASVSSLESEDNSTYLVGLSPAPTFRKHTVSQEMVRNYRIYLHTLLELHDTFFI